MNPNIFLPIINLMYRNYYLDEIEEQFLKEVFGNIQAEDLVDLVFMLKKYHLDSLSDVMNTKLKNTISETTVLDIMTKIDKHTRENHSQRFDMKNHVKRLCFDFFNDYMKKNGSFQTEEFFTKFENLDLDLKIELLSSYKEDGPKKDEDYWTQSEDEEEEEKVEEKKEVKEEIVEEEEEEPMSLKKHLCNLYSKGDFTDLTLISNEDEKFKVHKLLFASESPLLKDLLFEGLDTIKMDFPSSTVKLFIQWAYERIIKSPKDKEKELLVSLVKKYDVKGLDDALSGNVVSTQPVKKEFKFGWVLWNGSNGTTISEDKLTVTRTGSANLDRVFGSKLLVKPKHYFEVKLEKMSNGTETYIGITDNLSNTSSRKNISVQMAGTYKNLCQGDTVSWKEGDKVGVLIDYDNSICKFYKNGQFINISGSINPSKSYYAVCHFKFKNDKYTLDFPKAPKDQGEENEETEEVLDQEIIEETEVLQELD